MEDRYFQYVPFVGLPAACREFDINKDHSVIESTSVLEAYLCAANYARFGFVCAENLTALSGLAYLVFN